MRIERGDGQPRPRDAEQRLQPGRRDAAGAHDDLTGCQARAPRRPATGGWSPARRAARGRRASWRRRCRPPARPGTRCGRDGGSPHPAGSSSGSGLVAKPAISPACAICTARSMRLERRRRIGRVGLAGPCRRLELHGQHGQRRREDRSRRRPAWRSRARGTARPSLPARAASRAGSSIAKNGRAPRWRASQALRLSSPPMPAGSPIVTASGSGGRHGCLMSMVATRRRSRM